MTEETNVPAEGPAEGDAPVVEKTTEQQPEEKKTTETETPAEGEQTEETVIGAEGDEGEEVQPKKGRAGSQKLKRRLQMIESDFETTVQENAELKRRLEQLSQNEQGKPGVDREPKEDDFPNDYFAFERAHNQWSTRQILRQELDARQQSERETKNQREMRERAAERREAYDEQSDVARERIPDFDKTIASAKDVRITNQELIDEVMSSDKSALMHYYLAKNPEKVRELNALHGRELAREVGRLEARLHLPQPKKQTAATPPPSQPRGGASPPANLETIPMDEYVKIRNEQEARR